MGEGLKRARAAAKATRSESVQGGCPRCGGNHLGRHCKAPFRKSWPGKAAMVLRLRAADGSYVELTSDLSPELFERAQALQLDAIKQLEEPS